MRIYNLPPSKIFSVQNNIAVPKCCFTEKPPSEGNGTLIHYVSNCGFISTAGLVRFRYPRTPWTSSLSTISPKLPLDTNRSIISPNTIIITGKDEPCAIAHRVPRIMKNTSAGVANRNWKEITKWPFFPQSVFFQIYWYKVLKDYIITSYQDFWEFTQYFPIWL